MRSEKFSLSLIGSAVLVMTGSQLAMSAEQAAAMVTRIDPAKGGSARVVGNGRDEEVAFMMPLYEGDELTVASPNMTVQVKLFGGDDVMVNKTRSLRIEAPPEERGLFSSMMQAVSDKVFRNNQLSRRNLVTRGEGDDAPLVLFGFGPGQPTQLLVAGKRSLIARWSLDLDGMSYQIERVPDGAVVATGGTDGDFAFIDDVDFQAGREYRLIVRSADGRTSEGIINAVDVAPPVNTVDPESGTIGQAIQLLELAAQDDGRWKFEAIQGVVELSPDDIDRATLIEEISAL
ncbi:MAG: hypothetical protein WBN31_05000 [Gammaproteobacteria bacterium]